MHWLLVSSELKKRNVKDTAYLFSLMVIMRWFRKIIKPPDFMGREGLLVISSYARRTQREKEKEG